MWALLWIVASFLNFGEAANGSYVMSQKEINQCKEITCKDGYGYRTYYRVDSEDLQQIRKDSDVAFEMHIGIQGSANGHILLSPVLSPGDYDPVYEIVVGGGTNQFTEIRRNIKRNARTSVLTPNVLSPFEMRGFFIKITQDGLIEFGNEGAVLPLLSYKDVNPLEIKYFSFTAWYGTVVKFLYDCPVNDSTEPTMDSQEVPPPPLSASEELKRMHLLSHPPWIAPDPNMNVTLGIKVTGVKYNAFESKLATALSVVVSWKDITMAWEPTKFNGTKLVKFRPGQIWRPKFYVFNSDTGVFDSKRSSLITVEYSGEASFHFQTKVHTWCYDSQSTMSSWPHDSYMCTVVIQPWEAHDRISVNIMDPNDPKMEVYADVDDTVENEWETRVKNVIIKPSLWNLVYTSDDNLTHQSDRFIISLSLWRRPTSYNIVFYTPLVVLLVFILMSFWTESLKMERIWFYTGCIIVIIMGLCYIDYLIPCHRIPTILVFYIVVLAGVILALLVHVALMQPVTEAMCGSFAIQKMLSSNFVRTMFCLPTTKASANGGYMVQDDEDTEAIPNSRNVEEMEKENEQTHSKVRELAEATDRILFFAYTLTFGIMLALHF